MMKRHHWALIVGILLTFVGVILEEAGINQLLITWVAIFGLLLGGVGFTVWLTEDL